MTGTGEPAPDPGLGGVEPIRKRSLHDEVADRIRDQIIEGQLAPGERIDEARLIEQLHVSRTPFREALRTLAAEGLVDIRPSRGAHVHTLSPDEVLSMLEVLAELERLAGKLAMERASDAHRQDLLELHDAMMVRYAKRERLEYYKLNQRFHSRVAELSANPTLLEVQANIQSRLKRIRFIGNRDDAKWAAAVVDHEIMADAVRARDGAALGEIMHAHLMETWERVRDTL